MTTATADPALFITDDCALCPSPIIGRPIRKTAFVLVEGRHVPICGGCAADQRAHQTCIFPIRWPVQLAA